MTEKNANILRRVYPRVLARTLSVTRTLPEAEDAVQEAVVRALTTWPEQGPRDSPEAWLLTVAKNAHRDRVRKGIWEEPRQDALETLAQLSLWVHIAVGDLDMVRGWKDELLRVVFACCHPALGAGESAAPCLSTVVGLSIKETALAFVSEPRSMEQRLTRARGRLRQRGDPDGTTPEQSLDRLDAVLRVIHLLFNEGYWSSDEAAPIRADLCRLSIGLAHSLAEAFPREPEALALLALLTLHDARRDARLGVTGSPVPLPEQDRSRWDRSAITRAMRIPDNALAMSRRGPLQIEAAISATHCRASSATDTNWNEIAVLYGLLEAASAHIRRAGQPGVRYREITRSAGGARASRRPELDRLHHLPLRASRARNVTRRVGADRARTSLREAQRAARNGAEAAQIEHRIAQLGEAAS